MNGALDEALVPVKLLFDENLPRSLVLKLQDVFPNATHVTASGLAETPDLKIWEHAKNLGLAIVSKDSDFAEMVLRLGPPPSVIQLRIGNAATSQIANILREHESKIKMHVLSGGALLELGPTDQ